MDPTKAMTHPSVSHTETRKLMADFPCCEAPAGRGDPTRPDPAMIERALNAHLKPSDDTFVRARIVGKNTLNLTEVLSYTVKITDISEEGERDILLEVHPDDIATAAAIAREFAAAGAGPGEPADA